MDQPIPFEGSAQYLLMKQDLEVAQKALADARAREQRWQDDLQKLGTDLHNLKSGLRAKGLNPDAYYTPA